LGVVSAVTIVVQVMMDVMSVVDVIAICISTSYDGCWTGRWYDLIRTIRAFDIRSAVLESVGCMEHYCSYCLNNIMWQTKSGFMPFKINR